MIFENSYLKIENNHLVETNCRDERASLEQLVNFFEIHKPISIEDMLLFMSRWQTIKDKFERKQSNVCVVLCIGALNYLTNHICKTQFKTQEQLINPLNVDLSDNDNFIFEYSLNMWLNDQTVTGNKKEAACRILECKNQMGEELDLNSLGLSSLPECITRLENLKELDLSLNQLQALPEGFGNLVNLTSLYLSCNQLQALPEDFGNLVKLKILNLCYNQLQVLPEGFENFVDLRFLYLNNNKLQALPAIIGNFVKLGFLAIQHNQELRELPLRLGNLPKLTNLNIEGTQIPESMQRDILDSCRKLNNKKSKINLLFLLNKWVAIANQDNDSMEQLLKKLTNEEQSNLFEWLTRLEKTREFEKNQQKLAALTIKMLASLLNSEDFRKQFFLQVSSNNIACQDRSAMAYNEIHLSYRLCVEDESLSDKEKIGLMIRGAKTQALMKILSNAIATHQDNTNAIEQESVEIYLYFLTHLNKSLNLLLAIENMTYASIGKRDWIDAEDLKKATNQSYIDELISLPIFLTHLKKDPEFEEQWKALTDNAHILLNNADDKHEKNELNEGEYLNEMNKIMQDREANEKTLLKKMCHEMGIEG